IPGGEAEVADPAALGEEHDARAGEPREGDIGDGMADPGAGDRLGRTEEFRQQELAPHGARGEAAVLGNRHRPGRILLVLAGRWPVRTAEALAAPDRIVEADLAR